MDLLSFDWLFPSAPAGPGGADSAILADSAPVPSSRGSVVGTVPGSDLQNMAAAAGGATQGNVPFEGRGYRMVLGADDSLTIQVDSTPSSFPWNVLTSRYMICLVLVGVLVNRIQHVCRPRGRATRLRRGRRWLLRLPAISMLAYATGRQAVRVAQLWSRSRAEHNIVADFILRQFPPLPSLLAQHQADSFTLWISFLACCASVATESITRTMEGNHETSPPSNLVGLAFTFQSHQFDPMHAGIQYFLLILLQTAEAFALSLVGSFQRPPLRRLHITTFFGLLGISQWLYWPSSRGQLFLGFDRTPDIGMLAVISCTVLLHALTMILTEGKIQTDRLVFSSSNLPSVDDDFSLALFKLGTACLQSTRLNGLSKELVSIEIPAKSYVEVDDVGKVKMRLGLDALLRRDAAKTTAYTGLDNEIRLTVPSSRSGPQYESALLISSAKWTEIKRFIFTVLSIFGSLCRAISNRLPNVRHRMPTWVLAMPRRLRLVWHGQNGEREREERIARRRLDEERSAKVREEAIKSLLDRNGVELREGERLDDAAWRILREGAVTRAGGNHASDQEKAELFGIDTATWKRLEKRKGTSLPNAASSVLNEAGDSSDEEDEEWRLDADGEDDDDDEGAASDSSVTSSVYANRRSSRTSRSRSRSRSVFSPTPTPEDPQAADESSSLLQLARLDFDDGDNQNDYDESHPHSRGTSAFNRILLAHVASGDGSPPLTRAQYRSLIAPPEAAMRTQNSRAGSDLSSDGMEIHEGEADHLRSTILRRRHNASTSTDESPNAPQGSSSEDRQAERERLRLCVVCCFEERTILCWPCRCLALCDGCREELASRPGGGSMTGAGAGAGGTNAGTAAGGGGLQNCPTCRSKVHGFSRIYLP
ncbi:unnamed protein product [Parajaminaea phylloscopi]